MGLDAAIRIILRKFSFAAVIPNIGDPERKMIQKVKELRPTMVGLFTQVLVASALYATFRKNIEFFPIYLFSNLVFIFVSAGTLDRATKEIDEYRKKNEVERIDALSTSQRIAYAKNKSLRFFVNGYIFSFVPTLFLLFNFSKG